jgi:hypothetical protein
LQDTLKLIKMQDIKCEVEMLETVELQLLGGLYKIRMADRQILRRLQNNARLNACQLNLNWKY